MTKLSDLVAIPTVKTIHFTDFSGKPVSIPAAMTFDSINAIETAYGKSYTTFEKDLNGLLKRKQFKRDDKSMKLIWSLVYGLFIGGGVDCTYTEMNQAIPFTELPTVLEQSLEIINTQGFQEDDLKK